MQSNLTLFVIALFIQIFSKIYLFGWALQGDDGF